MENNITVFQNDEFGEIRTMVIDDEPWFVGKDVCDAFGDTHHKRSISKVDAEEKRLVPIIDRLGRSQNTYVVNESGLYSLLFNMQPKKARNGEGPQIGVTRIQERTDKLRKFKRWVTHDVLPSIRRNGMYATPEFIDKLLDDPNFVNELLVKLHDERDARQRAEQVIEEQKPLVDFANQVSNTKDLIDMGTMAKILNNGNIKIGRNRLFKLLRNNKILMEDNQPYQHYVDEGYFKVKRGVYMLPSGVPKITSQTLVTGKGQIYLTRKIKKLLS